MVIFSLSAKSFSQGHKIDITVSGTADSTIYFAYYYGDKKFVYDTLKADKNGTIFVHGDDKLPGGVYLVVLPDTDTLKSS